MCVSPPAQSDATAAAADARFYYDYDRLESVIHKKKGEELKRWKEEEEKSEDDEDLQKKHKRQLTARQQQHRSSLKVGRDTASIPNSPSLPLSFEINRISVVVFIFK